MSADVKYPDIAVKLTGGDGNAMSIMAAVAAGLRRNGKDHEVNEFMDEAMSGDYDNVLQTAMKWVSVS